MKSAVRSPAFRPQAFGVTEWIRACRFRLKAGLRTDFLRNSMIRKLTILIARVCGCIAAWSAYGLTDGKPADWLTDGGDSQRTAWQRDERIITTANARDMKLLWKIKLDNQPRELHNLLPALVVGRVSTASGPKQIVIV